MRKSVFGVGVLALALSAGLAGCDSESGAKADAPAAAVPEAESTAEADLAAIKAIQAQALRGYKEQNAALMSENHAEDIVMIVPGQKPIVGRDAVRQSTQSEMSPDSTMDFQADKIEIAKSGDLAYARGTYNYTYIDPDTKQRAAGNGNYVGIFKKQADGKWKVAEEISSE